MHRCTQILSDDSELIWHAHNKHTHYGMMYIMIIHCLPLSVWSLFKFPFGKVSLLFNLKVDVWFQFKDPLILLLLASALVSVVMRQVDDAVSITVVCIYSTYLTVADWVPTVCSLNWLGEAKEPTAKGSLIRPHAATINGHGTTCSLELFCRMPRVHIWLLLNIRLLL